MKIKTISIGKSVKIVKNYNTAGCSVRAEIELGEGETLERVNYEVNAQLDEAITADLDTILTHIQK